MTSLSYIEGFDALPHSTRFQINKAYETRLKWSQEKPRVYVCSPLGALDAAGIKQNMLAARVYADTIEKTFDVVAKAPHAWLPEFLDDHNPVERKIGIDVGNNMLRTADIVFVCGDRLSPGMTAEIALAKDLGITVQSFNSLLKKEIGGIVGHNGKHLSTPPGATQKSALLEKNPEEINVLQLSKKELLFQKSAVDPEAQKTFERRCKPFLNLLENYTEYRVNRDAGRSSVLRTKEEQMLALEKQIMKISAAAGLPETESKNHLEHFLNRTSVRMEEKLAIQNQQKKGMKR